MATYLIDLQDIYSGTTIQSNVQSSLIYPFIERAQNDFVKKLIGTAQYDDLTNKIILSGLTGLTSNDLLLQQNLKPMLTFYTWYYATPFLAVKFDNKGINKLTSDNSEGISESRQTDLINKILNLAQEAEGNALKFLRLNYQNYPLWREDIYYCEDTKPNTKLFGGIAFTLSGTPGLWAMQSLAPSNSATAFRTNTYTGSNISSNTIISIANTILPFTYSGSISAATNGQFTIRYNSGTNGQTSRMHSGSTMTAMRVR